MSDSDLAAKKTHKRHRLCISKKFCNAVLLVFYIDKPHLNFTLAGPHLGRECDTFIGPGDWSVSTSMTGRRKLGEPSKFLRDRKGATKIGGGLREQGGRSRAEGEH